MLRIGLTGGIGSGKSTVARIFEVFGIPVYYADQAARSIMNEDPELKKQIVKHFGTESYMGGTGNLNRSYLSAQVFNDQQKLELLNSLVHPATIRTSEKWMKEQVSAYAVKEAALIFESGTQTYLDYVVGVYAPKPLRIQRTIRRDAISREDVLKRMGNQIEEEIKMRLCDFMIYNDEQKPLLTQVLQLHKKLLELSGNNTKG